MSSPYLATDIADQEAAIVTDARDVERNIDMLPQWAQDGIRALVTQRDEARGENGRLRGALSGLLREEPNIYEGRLEATLYVTVDALAAASAALGKMSEVGPGWQWKERVAHGRTILVAVDPSGRWDGDDAGNEWACGYAIHQDDDGRYSVFEDDGRGNGDFVGVASDLHHAKAVAIADSKRRAGAQP